jgi:hypothetical protein
MSVYLLDPLGDILSKIRPSGNSAECSNILYCVSCVLCFLLEKINFPKTGSQIRFLHALISAFCIFFSLSFFVREEGIIEIYITGESTVYIKRCSPMGLRQRQ